MPRTISVFHMDSRRLADPGTPAKVSSLPPNVFSNTETDSAITTIVLFEGLNTRLDDQLYAQQQVARFLGQLNPEDRVGIYSLGRTLRVLHEFTSDASGLLSTLKKFKGESQGDVESSNPVPASTNSDTLNRLMNDLTHREADFANRNRVQMTVEAMKIIARRVERMPGRKNLVWVSGSFPIAIGFQDPIGSPNEPQAFQLEIESAAQALMNANVAVYPVDARGLMTDQTNSAATAAQLTTVNGQLVVPKPDLRVGADEHTTMDLIAGRTGGLAFYNNDLLGTIRHALDDSEVTYTLGFYLDSNEMDSKFHEIRVKVERKGVNVRTRKGYIASTPEPTPAPAEREQLIRSIADAPLDAAGVTIGARYDRMDRTKPNAVTLTAYIDTVPLQFSNQDGKFVDLLDLSIAEQAADGRTLKIASEVIRMNLSPERYRQVKLQAFPVQKMIEVLPNTRFVRVVVYDRGSGLIGSARGAVQVDQP
jgi:VWFA-related protein